jgi:hypothetical protein
VYGDPFNLPAYQSADCGFVLICAVKKMMIFGSWEVIQTDVSNLYRIKGDWKNVGEYQNLFKLRHLHNALSGVRIFKYWKLKELNKQNDHKVCNRYLTLFVGLFKNTLAPANVI